MPSAGWGTSPMAAVRFPPTCRRRALPRSSSRPAQHRPVHLRPAPTSASVRAGTKVAYIGTVKCTSGSLTNGVVDFELHDAAGNKVLQTYYASQNESAGQSRSYSFTWKAPSAKGTYSVQIGTFGP